MRRAWILPLLAGCQSTPPAGDITLRMQPMVTMADGVSAWTAAGVERQIAVARTILAPAFNLDVAPVFWSERPDLATVQREQFVATVGALAKEWAEQTGRLLVLYCDRITDANGQEWGGLANYPSNLLFSNAQHGVAVSVNSYRDATAHELGHAFDLPHPANYTQCLGPNLCDLMAYCSGWCPTLTSVRQDQIDTMRYWSCVYPRNAVCELPKAVRSARLVPPVYTLNTEPVE